MTVSILVVDGESDIAELFRQRFRRPFGDQMHGRVHQHRTEPVIRGFGGEHLGHQTAPQRCLDEVGPLGEETCGAGTAHVAVQLGRSHHASRSLGERRARGGAQAASPDGALTSSGNAALAASKSVG